MTKQNLRMFAYLRKSTDEKGKQHLSLDGQRREVERLVDRYSLDVVGDFRSEARSAKTPGRPVFDQMMKDLYAGKADGIVCWHLDRLARNPKDGGAVMWALDQGVIKRVVTSSGIYDADQNDTQLLSAILFGLATKQSRDLSTNVKRGNTDALEKGLWPGRPPLGYRRAGKKAVLEKDLPLFDHLRQCWRHILTGMPVMDVLGVAQERYGIRTQVWGERGGKLLTKSSFYRLLRKEFYAGVMVHNGRRFPGSHPPMVTPAEFARVQTILDGRRVVSHASQPLEFAYRGLLDCGACGGRLTAERKTNRHGSHYVYYHCWRRARANGNCREPSIGEAQLQESLVTFFGGLTIPPRFAIEVTDILQELDGEAVNVHAELAERGKKELARCEKREQKLLDLYLDGRVDEAGYADRQKLLATARHHATAKLAEMRDAQRDNFEPARTAFSALTDAKRCFEAATKPEQRELVRSFTSNPTLKDGLPLITAKKPYAWYGSLATSRSVCPARNVLREHILENIEDYAAIKVPKYLRRFVEGIGL